MTHNKHKPDPKIPEPINITNPLIATGYNITITNPSGINLLSLPTGTTGVISFSSVSGVKSVN